MSTEQQPQRLPVGVRLLEARIITREQYVAAAVMSARRGCAIEESLLEMGALSARELAVFLALELDTPYLDVKELCPDPDVLGLIPETLVRGYGLLPLALYDGELVVATGSGENVQDKETLEAFIGRKVCMVIGTGEAIAELIEHCYPAVSAN